MIFLVENGRKTLLPMAKCYCGTISVGRKSLDKKTFSYSMVVIRSKTVDAQEA